MPTKKNVEYVIYKFDELSDKAKEKARDWWRDCENRSGSNYWSEGVIEDAKQCADRLGIDIAQREFKTMGGGTGYEPKIWWTGFSSQGDGACFEGTWEWPQGQTQTFEARIKEHAPLDEKLHHIALTLDDLQQRHSHRLKAVVKHSGHYYHSGCTDIEVSKIDDEGNEEDFDNDTYIEVKSALRRFMDWIYGQLEKEYEYFMSDEQIDEAIRCNDYEFFENGKRATI